MTQALRMSCCNSSVLGPVNSSISVMNPFCPSESFVVMRSLRTERSTWAGRGERRDEVADLLRACREGLDLTTARVDDLLPRSQLDVRRTQRLHVWPAGARRRRDRGPAGAASRSCSPPPGGSVAPTLRARVPVRSRASLARGRRPRPGGCGAAASEADGPRTRAPAHRQAVDRHRPGRQDLEVWHVGTQRSTGDHRPLRCRCTARGSSRSWVRSPFYSARVWRRGSVKRSSRATGWPSSSPS